MSRDLYLYSKKEKATIKKILDSLQQADDMTMALDFIRSAILLVCTESATANDGHVVTDMEEKTGIKRGTYSNYENGKTEPKLETWQKLASFFHVSVPYLQGFININIPNDLKFESKQDAIDCIEKIMKALDISKEDLRTEHENEFKKS